MSLAVVVLVSMQAAAAPAAATDTIRIEVGSPHVDGRVYTPSSRSVTPREGPSCGG